MLVLAAALLFTFAAAQAPVADAPNAPTSAELQAFFESELPPLIQEHRVPGVAVSVVVGGEVRHAEGYGFARLAPDVPATAHTPFQTGSVSKMLTFTALMQQVELGAIYLNADVNLYLQEFTVQERFGAAITPLHLLTHTAGFEDLPVVGLLARDEAALLPLGELLTRHLPDRVRPPGEEAAYSNYGAALAGYLVELATGEPFADAVQSRVLTPLGMTDSSIQQPVAADLAGRTARGYLYEDGEYRWPGPEYVPLGPAGGLHMSASDAARFMLLHLGETPGVLATETAEAMRAPLHQARSDMPGMGAGWWQSDRHGQRILTHEGDTNEAHALMALMPEVGEGLFLATNAPGGQTLRAVLWEKYLDRFHAVADPVAVPGVDLRQYEGTYLLNRYSTSTIGKLGRLLGFVNVSATQAGLELPPLLGPDPMLLVPQGNDVFVDLDTNLTVFFTRGDDGAVATFHPNPSLAFHRAAAVEHPVLHLVALGGSLLLSVVALVVLLFRRPARARRAHWFIAATAAGPALSVAALLTLVGDPFSVVFGVTPGLLVTLTLVNLAAVLAVGGVVVLARAWRGAVWPKELPGSSYAGAPRGAGVRSRDGALEPAGLSPLRFRQVRGRSAAYAYLDHEVLRLGRLAHQQRAL